MTEFDDAAFERFKAQQVPAPKATSTDFNDAAFEAYKASQPKTSLRLPVGSVAGSVVLPLAFSGVGTPAAIGLGALGAMGGEAGQRVLERKFGFGPPAMSPQDELKNIATQGAYQVGGDLLGRGVGAAVGKVLSPFGKTVTPEGKEATKFLAGRVNPPLLPAEATSSRMLDFFHNIAEHGFGGMGKIASYKEARQGTLRQMQQEFLDSLAREATPDDAARMLLDSLKGNQELSGKPAQLIYTALEKAAQGATVNIQQVKAALAPMTKIAQQASGLEDRAMGTQVLRYINDLPDVVPYNVAKEIRTQVRTYKDMLQKGIETKNAKGIGVADKIYGQLTDAIEGGLRQSDPFIADMWKEANFLERAAQLQNNPKVVRQLFQKAAESGKADPQSVVTAIQNSGPEPIKIIRNAVNPSDWKTFQRVTMEGLMTKAGLNKEGGLQGEQWLQAMFGGGPGARAKMEAIFDPQTIANAERFGQTLRTIQSKQGAKEGSMWIQLTQAGALGGVLFGSKPIQGGSLAILTTPPVLAYIMTHPTLSKWFINGIQLPASSPIAASTLGKVLAAIPQTIYAQPTTPRLQSDPEQPPAGPVRPFPLAR